MASNYLVEDMPWFLFDRQEKIRVWRSLTTQKLNKATQRIEVFFIFATYRVLFV